MPDNLLDLGDPSEIDPNKNYRDEFVGEGKKYKTDEDAFRALAHSQRHIPILETQMDALREDFLKAKQESTVTAKLEDLIAKYENLNKQSTSNEQTLVNEDPKRPSYNPDELKSLVSKEVLEIENSKKQLQNFELVKSKLKERYGDNTIAIKQQMNTLGLSEARLNEMAKTEPMVLIRALGLEQAQTESFQAPPRSNQRSDNFSPTVNTKRTWSFYQKMRKENPTLYHSRQTNINMEKDAVSLGKDFQDGDFDQYN